MKHLKWGLVLMLSVIIAACGSGDSSLSPTSSGQPNALVGSSAAIIAQRGFIILIDSSGVQSFEPDQGRLRFRSFLWQPGAETLFPYKDDLIMVGTERETRVIKIDEDGDMETVSTIVHARSCDPVVANDTHMYITLRSGTRCGISTGENTLLMFNIEDIERPIFIRSVSLEEPLGLALTDEELFVCHKDGLKRFDISDSEFLIEVANYPDAVCNDLIAQDNARLLITGDEAIRLVNVSNASFTQESSIERGE